MGWVPAEFTPITFKLWSRVKRSKQIKGYTANYAGITFDKQRLEGEIMIATRLSDGQSVLSIGY